MKSILSISDISHIKDVLSHDNIYDTIAYDDSPSLQDYAPRGIWFELLQEDTIAGMINLEPLNNVLWQPHIFIFEEYRGNGSTEWGQLVIEHCGVQKFIAFTPYEQARKYAEKIGFKYIATLEKSIKKNGVLLDQYILEK